MLTLQLVLKFSVGQRSASKVVSLFEAASQLSNLDVR